MKPTQMLIPNYLTKHGTELTLTQSANLYYFPPLSRLLSSFFLLIESEISEQVSKQRLVNIPSAVIDIIIMREETKILKEKVNNLSFLSLWTLIKIKHH